jgi:hypothetical protein
MQRSIATLILSGLILTSVPWLSVSTRAAEPITHTDTVARSTLGNFDQLKFAATDLRISMRRQRTESQVNLNIQNRSDRSRSLTLPESMAIERIVLVDALDRSYSPTEIAGDLSQPMPLGATLTLFLKFDTPTGARPSYLFIERTQGESITVKL